MQNSEFHDLKDHIHFSPRPPTNMQKITLFHLFILEIEPVLESHGKSGQTHFLTIPPQKFSNQLLNFMNMYRHAENPAITYFHFRDIVNFKILQPDWMKAFWPTTHNLEFSQI